MGSPPNPNPHQPQPSNASSSPSDHHAGPPSTPVRNLSETPRRSTRRSKKTTDFWTLPGTRWEQLSIERQKKSRSGQRLASDYTAIQALNYESSTQEGLHFSSCQPAAHVKPEDQAKTSGKSLNRRQADQSVASFTESFVEVSNECVSSAASPSGRGIRQVNPGLTGNQSSSNQRGQSVSGKGLAYRFPPPTVSPSEVTASRIMARRPGRNQVDYVAELKESIHESLSKLSGIQEKLAPLGQQIIALEEELKAKETSSIGVTLDDTNKLDELYRKKIKLTEQETSILHNPPDDLINKMGILNALAAREDNQAPGRGSAATKQRGSKRSTVDSESMSVDSPGPSPSDVRSSDLLRRVKGSGQRSSSVASQTARDSGSRYDDGSDSFRSGLAERAKLLVLHAEVAYKQSKATHDSDGERIHCTINGIRKDKASGRPLYDIKDKDESENLLYTAKFEDLLPIPPPGSQLATFSPGKYVIALYPGTTTFYNAQVISLIPKRDVYSLKFEGEENEKEVKEVERRYVLDTKTK